MTLFLLRVKNSARIPCFARYLAGLIIQRKRKRGRDGMRRDGASKSIEGGGGRRRGGTAGETINYRSSALSLEIPAELATDILNLHRRPGESFVRISLRESREKPWGRAPVWGGGVGKGERGGNSLRSGESREGYLIRSPRSGRLLPNTFCKRSRYIDLSPVSPLKLAGPMYSGNKIFLSF